MMPYFMAFGCLIAFFLGSWAGAAEVFKKKPKQLTAGQQGFVKMAVQRLSTNYREPGIQVREEVVDAEVVEEIDPSRLPSILPPAKWLFSSAKGGLYMARLAGNPTVCYVSEHGIYWYHAVTGAEANHDLGDELKTALKVTELRHKFKGANFTQL